MYMHTYDVDLMVSVSALWFAYSLDEGSGELLDWIESVWIW